MTFSLSGRCARTGAFGVAIATSSIAVGARCPHARAGVGAVATTQAGATLGQVVRRVRTFAEDFARRMDEAE